MNNVYLCKSQLSVIILATNNYITATSVRALRQAVSEPAELLRVNSVKETVF